MESSLDLGKKYFYSKDYKKAFEYFKQDSLYYEMGLSKLLQGDEKEARKYFEENKNPCLATLWGLSVLDLINLKSSRPIGFFQIRAFLEVYLNLFLENELYDYAENLISAYPIFSKVNYESCKFIARVLFSHNYINATLDFIKKSKLICSPDPEALLIEAQCYVIKEEFDLAKDAIDELLMVVPDYMPALKLKDDILEKLS